MGGGAPLCAQTTPTNTNTTPHLGRRVVAVCVQQRDRHPQIGRQQQVAARRALERREAEGRERLGVGAREQQLGVWGAVGLGGRRRWRLRL
jgi:hypothetical protein